MHKFDGISGHHAHSQAKTAHSFLTGSSGATNTQCSIKAINDDD